MKYLCECCGYSTNRKSNYSKHILTEKHLVRSAMYQNVSKCIQNVSKCIQNVSISDVSKCIQKNKKNKNVSKCIQKNNSEKSEEKLEELVNSETRDSEPKNVKIFECKYCNKSYKYSQGLSKHIKYSCKKNKDEDLKELVRLMNEQLKMKNETIDTAVFIKEIEKRDKAIELLTKKLDVVGLDGNSLCKTMINNSYKQMNNTQNNVNIQNNITLNLKETNMSFLTQKDYSEIFGRLNMCIPALIKKVHCNKEHPENMNIYIPNIKNKYIMVYEDGDWKLKNRDEIIDYLIEDRACCLEEWLDNQSDDKCGKMKQKFNNFQEEWSRNHNQWNKRMKEEIQEDLYNITQFVKERRKIEKSINK